MQTGVLVCRIYLMSNIIYIYMSYGRNYLFGGMPSPNVGGPLSVIRVLNVRDINIKAEACNLHCGMMWFATWSRKSGLSNSYDFIITPTWHLCSLSRHFQHDSHTRRFTLGFHWQKGKWSKWKWTFLGWLVNFSPLGEKMQYVKLAIISPRIGII